MSSEWGRRLHISIFGESHGEGIGMVLDGVPPGEPIDFDALRRFALRRAPGRDKAATPRKESDQPQFLSGFLEGVTTGAPICAVIRNENTRSGDYRKMETLARPGHADYTGYLRYKGYNDIRGGGHFSARLTAPLVLAGGLAKQMLERRGVTVGAHLYSCGLEHDRPFDPVQVTPEELRAAGERPFPTLTEESERRMRETIENARLSLDSVGGVVECCALGLPAGIGDPIFGGVENILSSILFGIPAMKGLEFGEGFGAARLFGSCNNDPFYMDGEEIRTRTNRHGGILGGITSGMPLIFRAAFKPTPSIAREQQTVDYRARTDALLTIQGRHDPCLAVRAVPCVEAAAALGLLELLLSQ
ncbi:MAG: chorismate synthase [Provencibacterium sp.]|jgi:chorismate synthase|nr:chorismate synthase [Provencibacterium sp.]